ncbi:hypothetical protein D7243_10535 [Stutzerimonas stutzeri]|nr:hypothetical protein [Stutzerimonas stutzeri]
MAVPAPKLNELHMDRLAIFEGYAASFQLDLFACKRLERQLNELMALPEFEAGVRLELGLLHAIRRNMNEAKRHIARAGQLSVERQLLAMNQAHAALLNGEVLDAADHVASLSMKGDATWLRSVRTLAVQCGMYTKAMEAVEALNKLKAPQFCERRRHLVDSVDEIVRGSEIISERGLTDMDVVQRVHVAAQVVAANAPKAPLLVYGYSCSREAGILYEFPLSLPTDDLVRIDWEISEALVDAFDDPLTGTIGFSTRPYSESLRCVA